MKLMTDEILAKMSNVQRQAAEQVVEWTIGKHTLRVLKNGRRITLRSLLDSLEREVTRQKPEHMSRLIAEAAIRRLRSAAAS